MCMCGCMHVAVSVRMFMGGYLSISVCMHVRACLCSFGCDTPVGCLCVFVCAEAIVTGAGGLTIIEFIKTADKNVAPSGFFRDLVIPLAALQVQYNQLCMTGT